MRAALLCALFIAPLPAAADGPALAHLTIAGRTATLTELTPAGPGTAMVFAQMHLGFPMPPTLELVIDASDEGPPVLHHPDLDDAGHLLDRDQFLAFEPERAVLTGTNDRFQIAAEALSRKPLGQFAPLPVEIEIQLTSP